MSRWTQDAYAKAWDFATKFHRGQTYGGKAAGEQVDYINHVASVAMELIWALESDKETDGDLAVQCALLHDTVEDTEATFELVSAEFGGRVAAGVLALSKNPDLPKTAQLADSLRRIKQQPREVWMVKMADRIANLYHPPFYWDNTRIIAYRTEATTILDVLGPANSDLARRLEEKIGQYSAFLRG